MGNTPGVPEEAEDDSTCRVKSCQPLPECDSAQNGSVLRAQSPPPAASEAGARAAAGRDNGAVSAAEPSTGSAARRAQAAARPRSLLAVPWAVPGRAEGAAAAPAEPAEPAGPDTAPGEGRAAQQGAHTAPAQPTAPTGTPEGQHEAAPKAKAVTLLDRIFRLEKGPGSARGDGRQGRPGSDRPDGSIAPNAVPLGKEIDECTQKELGQDSAGEEGPAAAAPGRAQLEQDSAQAAAAQGSVMSFLKTLVSPSKAEAKSDSEDKAVKETQQTTNTKSPEQPPVPCVKADRNVPPSQEPPAKQNPKAPEAVAPVQAVATETPREATKDKGSATPLPLSKLFWKKNSSEEAEAVSNEKAEVALEAVAPDRDESKSAESAELKARGAESKTPKANLRRFFKLSVKGAGGTPSSEEGDAPSPRHHHEFIPTSANENRLASRIPPCQTLNATEKPLAPSDSDPGGQRSKEGSKDKKSTLELAKQKGREQPEPREGAAAEPDPVQNGGDAKEPPGKRTEKRQSLGGFFKGLGSKRMSDAEVQTDPVSILPAGKSK